MSAKRSVSFGYFLRERKVRIKPAEANTLGLKRVDKIDFSANIHLSDRATNTDMILVKPGDLLISGINAEKGAVAVYQGEKDVLASIHYSSYEYDPEKIEIEFLKWFLKSPNFKSLLLKSSTGGIKTELKAKHLLPLEIELPDPKTQKSIVRSIEHSSSSVNEICSEISSQLSDLQHLRQAILQEAVQGKLVPQNKNDEPASELLKKIKAEKEALVKAGKLKKEKPLPPISEEEIPFKLPKGWVWCRLGEVLLNTEYGTSEKATAIGEVPILRMNNIQDGKLDYAKLKYVKRTIKDLPKLFLKNRDLIFNRTNSFELVGKSGVFYGNDNEYTLASYLIRVQVPHQYLNVDFLNHYVNSIICRETQIEPEITQQTGQANFSGSKLKNIYFPLAPVAEQHRIVSKVESLKQTCDALELELKQAQEDAGKLLQAVLREGFEG